MKDIIKDINNINEILIKNSFCISTILTKFHNFAYKLIWLKQNIKETQTGLINEKKLNKDRKINKCIFLINFN